MTDLIRLAFGYVPIAGVRQWCRWTETSGARPSGTSVYPGCWRDDGSAAMWMAFAAHQIHLHGGDLRSKRFGLTRWKRSWRSRNRTRTIVAADIDPHNMVVGRLGGRAFGEIVLNKNNIFFCRHPTRTRGDLYRPVGPRQRKQTMDPALKDSHEL